MADADLTLSCLGCRKVAELSDREREVMSVAANALGWSDVVGSYMCPDCRREMFDAPFVADPERHGSTGIHVRGKRGESWDAIDIAQLDRDSLIRWLRSRGDDRLAVGTVLVLLFHATLDEGE